MDSLIMKFKALGRINLKRCKFNNPKKARNFKIKKAQTNLIIPSNKYPKLFKTTLLPSTTKIPNHIPQGEVSGTKSSLKAST